MAEIKQFLEKENIFEKIKARDKKGVIKELLDNLVKGGKIPSSQKSQILKKLLEREDLGSTALGQGFALPHAKIKNLDRTIVCVGCSKQGVDFDSLDGESVYIIFLLIVNEKEFGLHLKLLASCARMLRDKFFRKRIMDAKSRQDIYNIIKHYGEEDVK